MQEITSKDNQYIKLAASLHNKKTRDELGLFLIEGKTLIEEALKKKQKLKYIFSLEEKSYTNIDCFLIDENLMSKIASTESPPPIVAIVEKEKSENQLNGNFFIFGEDIRDPGNLGSIIRTAFASGVNKIFLSKNSCDLYNPKTLRSSVGTVFYGDIEYIDLKDLLENLISFSTQQNKKLEIIGTSSHAKDNIFEANFANDSVYLVLIGSEAEGLSQEATKACSKLIKIPLQNDIESINVLAAASIILFEIARQVRNKCHPEGA